MVTWQSRIAEGVRSAVRGDCFWQDYLGQSIGSHADPRPVTLHLAVLVEPYLQYILAGQKTIESRFSSRRCAPYEQVRKGDIVLLKRVSGPILGICQVTDAWFYRLDTASWKEIREEFSRALCAQDPLFWETRKSASYATLMRIARVRPIEPIDCGKRDRRGWVVIQSLQNQSQLGLWHQ